MFPDQEPCVRDFTTRCDRRISLWNLLHTSLDQWTWYIDGGGGFFRSKSARVYIGIVYCKEDILYRHSILQKSARVYRMPMQLTFWELGHHNATDCYRTFQKDSSRQNVLYWISIKRTFTFGEFPHCDARDRGRIFAKCQLAPRCTMKNDYTVA